MSPFTTGQQVYDVFLLATGNRELADKARADWAMNELRAGNQPEL